jgi:uncharacterized protein (TIGR02594 family)
MKIQLALIGIVALASSAFGQDEGGFPRQLVIAPSPTPLPADKLPPMQQTGANGYDGKKVIQLAEAELGTFKIPGQDDPRVKQYCTDTFQNDDVYSSDGWCSAFVSFIMRQAGYKFSPNNTDFGWMYVMHRVEEPQPGDIAMLDSHIAFFLGRKVNSEGLHVVGLLGGNQDYQVCVMWVPESDIEYYGEADVAQAGWLPSKHIPNGSSSAGAINVLDDRHKFTGHSLPNFGVTQSGHPL